MASFSVRAGGSDTDPYDTWAKAATRLDLLINGTIPSQTTTPAAGDVIYVDSALVSAIATGTMTITGPSSTGAGALRVISVDSTGDPQPPVVGDYLRGAKLQVTDLGGSTIDITGRIHMAGVEFNVGQGMRATGRDRRWCSTTAFAAPMWPPRQTWGASMRCRARSYGP